MMMKQSPLNKAVRSLRLAFPRFIGCRKNFGVVSSNIRFGNRTKKTNAPSLPTLALITLMTNTIQRLAKFDFPLNAYWHLRAYQSGVDEAATWILAMHHLGA